MLGRLFVSLKECTGGNSVVKLASRCGLGAVGIWTGGHSNPDWCLGENQKGV